MKKIILTGGGTAGHVTPHIALLPKLKEDYEIHYIGSKDGIEKEIISKFNYVKYHEITCVKLIRSLTLKNLAIPFKLIKGTIQSKKLIKQIKPQVVFSKGGFVSVPVAYAAKFSKVPVISHESDLTMGLANKLILKVCKVMCCSFEKTAQKCKKKCVFTGSPIREELFNGSKVIALEQCKFKNPVKPNILIMGGSLGAKAINKVVVKALNDLTKNFNIIHIVGKGNLTDIQNDSYYEIEFTNDVQHYFALSDLVVSRAGSNSINEFLALKKPMLLIPLPKEQSRGDQILNAEEFKNNNYCDVLEQKNLTKESLIKSVNNLYNKRFTFVKTMSALNIKNASDTIVKIIEENL